MCNSIPFPCPRCGRPSTVPNTVRCTTGSRRYRVCEALHRFTTFQVKGEEEKLALVLQEPPAPLEVPEVQWQPEPLKARPVKSDELKIGKPPKFAGRWDERMHREWLVGLISQVQRG